MWQYPSLPHSPLGHGIDTAHQKTDNSLIGTGDPAMLGFVVGVISVGQITKEPSVR
jgi:hypothetical protein